MPQLVPEIYHVDREMRLFIMQDLGASPVLRGEMLDGRVSPRLAEDLSTFLAETLFHTTDLWLEPKGKKEEVRRFLNPHMCSITEDLIFTAPFELLEDFGYDATEHLELITSLCHDGRVKSAVADIKLRFMNCAQALLTPYSALVFFALGLFLSSFVFNTIVMLKPFAGSPVPLGDYFSKGNLRLHAVGILGGLIWCLGMSLAILAGDTAGYAISYGLGQGATMVAAFWGVFIWREFRDAPAGTGRLLTLMFVLFIVGLMLIVYANMHG